MAQVIDKVRFISPGGMTIKNVHEGDVYRVSEILRKPDGFNVYSDVSLVRVKNNAAITRLID